MRPAAAVRRTPAHPLIINIVNTHQPHPFCFCWLRVHCHARMQVRHYQASESSSTAYIYLSSISDNCQTKVDLMFVVDMSGSITPEGYHSEQKFIATLVDFFDIGRVNTLFAYPQPPSIFTETRTLVKHTSAMSFRAQPEPNPLLWTLAYGRRTRHCSSARPFDQGIVMSHSARPFDQVHCHHLLSYNADVCAPT